MAGDRSAYQRMPEGPWLRTFRFAGAGLSRVWRSERNFRVQLAAGWSVLMAGALARLPSARFAVLVGVVFAVLTMETLNSAVEMVVDLVSPDEHPVAGAAKDLGAGAVLLMSLGSVAAGLVIFWPLPDTLFRLGVGAEAHPWMTTLGVVVLAMLILLAASPLPGRRKA